MFEDEDGTREGGAVQRVKKAAMKRRLRSREGSLEKDASVECKLRCHAPSR